MIVENSKLNKYSHLVEYSWQTWCLSTQRYPTTVRQDPYLFKAKTWNASPLCLPLSYPFYTDITNVTITSLHNAPVTSCITTYIAISPYDALMMSCSFLMGNPHTCIITLEQKSLNQSMPAVCRHSP